jgi:hypothetical protein
MKGLLGKVKPTFTGQITVNECRILHANPLITGVIFNYRHALHVPVKEVRLIEV